MLASDVNKLQIIKLYEDPGTQESWSVYAALVACLSPDEGCAALDLNLEQDWRIRRVILNKISKDIQKEFLPRHRQLIEDLKSVYETVSYNKKRTCGYHLSLLCEFLPTDYQVQVIKFLLQSKYVAIRGSGYKRLRNLLRTVPSFPLSEIPIDFDDLQSVQIIIDFFPEEFVNQHFEKLQEMVFGTYYLARLYLKTPASSSARIDDLRRIDEITYAYICTKTSRVFDDAEALHIFERNKYDDRVGLLTWCFGQMQLWNTLQSIAETLDDLESIRWKYRAAKLRSPDLTFEQFANNKNSQ